MSSSNKDLFSKNLIKHLQLSGKSRNDIIDDLGYSKSIISEWINKKKYPRIDAVQRLSNYFGISISDLIEDKSNDLIDKKTIKIPVLGKAPCGKKIETIKEILSYEEVDSSYGANNKSNMFALIARGDSMEPLIIDGDTLIVKLQENTETGKIFIIKVNGFDETCKKISLSNDGITLIPVNPHYDPIYYDKQSIISERISIIGRVIEIRRKL